MTRGERVQSGVLQGSACWTGPAVPGSDGSMQPSIIGLPEHVEVRFYKVCRDGLLVQRVGGLWERRKEEMTGVCMMSWVCLIESLERTSRTISYRARERAFWKRANSLRSWIVMTSFQAASRTTPTSRMLPTTASSTMRASGPPPHSEGGNEMAQHTMTKCQCTFWDKTHDHTTNVWEEKKKIKRSQALLVSDLAL